MDIKKLFTDISQFRICVLAIFSGAPLAIIYSTLSAWLKEGKIEIAVITTFAAARIFYSLKFLWAPFVDQIKLPVLGFLGQRRSWMLLCSSIIGLVLLGYSLFEPRASIANIFYLTLALGIASATFDIAFDAYRIESFSPEHQAMAAANTMLGYRLGMLISGAGALWFADNYGWKMTFNFLAILFFICNLLILIIPEPKIERQKFNRLSLSAWKNLTIIPYLDFFKRQYALLILAAIVFYKLGDAMFGVVATPFYLELGFSKTEISAIVKFYGLGATLIGSYIGGYIMFKKGDIKGLITAGIIQMLSNASFIWLNHQGYDPNALTIAITIENIGSGISNVALISYLGNLCNRNYSATQYALLSSASGLFSHTIVIYGGSLQQMLGWDMYFIVTILLAIPGLVLLYYLNYKLNSMNTDTKLL